MYRTLKSPTNVQVEITDICNHRCRHCYNAFRHENTPLHTMTEEQVDYLLDQLEKWQVARCIVTGGESLVVPEIVLRLVDGVIARKMSTAINTNMSLFNQEFGERLLALGADTIMTSLMADTPELFNWITQRETFFRVSENIQLAVKMGFRVAVNMVLTDWNIDRVRQTGDLAGSWRVGSFGATRACAPCPIAREFEKHLITVKQVRESLATLLELQERWGYTVDVYEHYPWCVFEDVALYSYMARRRCTAGVNSAVIAANGDLRPCGHSVMTYGNIFEEGLHEPWLRMDDWREQSYISEECRECEHFLSCGGGCPMEVINLGRDPHHTKPEDVITVPDRRVELPIVDGRQLAFYDDVLFRKEKFGGVLISGRSKMMLVGEQTFQLAIELAQKNIFTVETLTCQYGIKEDEATGFLGQLLYKRLVKDDRVGY